MANSPQNLVMGPGTLYFGAVGATEPDATTNAGINATPAVSAWTPAGGTAGGFKIIQTNTWKDLELDQWTDTPGTRLTARQTSFQTSLAELTVQNMAYALNGGTAATGTTNSYTPALSPSSFVPNYVALLFDGIGINGFRRRLIIRRCVNTANIETDYKSDTQSLYTVNFMSYGVSDSVAPYVYADATA